MPLASETVPNKALSGAELKAVLRDKFNHLISNDSMLADHIAYGRITFDITLRLHTDNPYLMAPSAMASTISSSPVGTNILPSMPEMEALEAGPPLKSPVSGKSSVRGKRLTHTVTSPNAERLAHSLPVPVDIVQRDGSTRTETVSYPPQGEGGVTTVEDLTDQTRAELGVK